MTTPSQPADDRRLVPLTLDGLELELTEIELATVKPLLEAAGIEVVVQGATPLPNLPYELLVPEDELERATAILREALQAGPEGAEEAEAATEEPAAGSSLPIEEPPQQG
ncbi:MAG: DUF2007 domain-containing protein [Bryobacteraceae bacterium]|nr:DUF2007 domain-containing protein [Bryobacteraceae bacterium]MCX7605605.1 DUF2007 domain-containing protein [Bryobacteraceae bacterium]